MPVFDSEFFAAVSAFIERLKNLFKKSWPILMILGVILLILIFFQQAILSFLFGAL